MKGLAMNTWWHPGIPSQTKIRSAWRFVGVMVTGFGFGISPSLAQDENTAPELDATPEIEAQEAPAAESTGTTGTETRGGTTEPQLSETHQVTSGDTLWDLCSKYLNSPWYWPKIWSYNPQITNPHWIYPGNELRFYPSDENLPTPVEVSRAITAPDEESPLLLTEDEDLVKTTGKIEVGRIEHNSDIRPHIAFVEKADGSQKGEIRSAFDERVMLSRDERVYGAYETPPPVGQRVGVYRTIRELVHPETDESLGWVVEVLGAADVVAVNDKLATAILRESYAPIERGDWLGPAPDPARRIAPSKSTAQTTGMIIETMLSPIALVGEHDVVFIDRGQNEGVQTGNILTVYQRGDGYTGETEGLPWEDVGKVMVIDARSNASTAVVIRSVKEFVVGDRVEMKSGEG